MQVLTQPQLNKWKETFAKSGITYETDDEYREAVQNLIGYFEVLIEIDKRLSLTKKDGK